LANYLTILIVFVVELECCHRAVYKEENAGFHVIYVFFSPLPFCYSFFLFFSPFNLFYHIFIIRFKHAVNLPFNILFTYSESK